MSNQDGNNNPNNNNDLAAAMAQIAELKAALAAAPKPRKAPPVSFKVSDKGGLSVYGLGRWPTTLYAPQWARLLAVVPELKAFIEANKEKLADRRPEKVKEAPAEA
jgi:ABC-type Fe3+-hydroxamate transport system substrate-binding protein